MEVEEKGGQPVRGFEAGQVPDTVETGVARVWDQVCKGAHAVWRCRQISAT